MYALLDTSSQGRISESRFAAEYRAAAATATLSSLRYTQIGQRSGNVIPVPMASRRSCSAASARRSRCRSRAAARARGSISSRALLFPGLRGSERLRRVVSLAAAGDAPGRPTERRLRKALIAARRSPTWPARSSARSGRSRPTRPRSTPPPAIRPAPRSGSTGSSAYSRPGWRAPRAARCWPGTACSPRPRRRGADGHDHDRPRDRARRDRGDRRALCGDRGDEPADRRARRSPGWRSRRSNRRARR